MDEIKKKAIGMNRASTRYRFDLVKPIVGEKEVDYLQAQLRSEPTAHERWEEITKKYRSQEVHLLGIISSCERLYPADLIFGLVTGV